MLAIHMDDALLENALDVVRKHPLIGLTRSQTQAIKAGFGKA